MCVLVTKLIRTWHAIGVLDIPDNIYFLREPLQAIRVGFSKLAFGHGIGVRLA
jgi:hypothetical protein